MPVRFHFRPAFFGDFEDVKNFQDTDSVHNQQNDEPDFLIAFGGEPKRVAFPGDGPDC